jgi:HD-GYP domain-containing protein (c-di-GMP phosphodiesterase class II)
MLKTIKTEQVKSGMYIHELKSDWFSNPFWKSSFLLNAQEDLIKLQKSGIQFVVIDTKKGLDVEIIIDKSEDEDTENTSNEEVVDDVELSKNEASAAENQVDVAYQLAEEKNKPVKKSPKRVLASEERAAATKAINASKKAVASMFNDVRMGKAIDMENAMPVVEELTASVMRNEGALISLVRLKTQDDYTYMHSVAVCALMVALAKQLNLSEEQTRQAGLAGLMHDIGKAAIPNEILNKPGALTDEEFAQVKLHPERGHALLLQAKVTDEATLDVCLHHHEKVDGSGYPKKLNGEQISLLAKMGAVCDVYDAVTSNRPYKAGWEPGISLQRMAKWTNHFDDLVFKAFVKSVGIYPIGTVVKLKSGLLGVVIDQSPKSLLTPIVKVFFSTKDRTYLTPMLLDLSDKKSKDEIASQEDPAIWGIKNLSSYWAE